LSDIAYLYHSPMDFTTRLSRVVCSSLERLCQFLAPNPYSWYTTHNFRIDWQEISMTVATINIQVNDRIAQLYAASTEVKRARLRKLIAYLVQEFSESTPESLLASMDAMSRESAANGLTPAILESLLRDDA